MPRCDITLTVRKAARIKLSATKPVVTVTLASPKVAITVIPEELQ